MNKVPIFLLGFALAGCSAKSAYDITPEQAKSHAAEKGGLPSGLPDFNKLPPGAVKNAVHFKKGDRLPNGSIADKDETFGTVEIPDGRGAPAGKQMFGGKPGSKDAFITR